MQTSIGREMVLIDNKGSLELWVERAYKNGKKVEVQHWFFNHQADKTTGYPVPMHTLSVEAAKYWLENIHKHSARTKAAGHAFQSQK